MHDNTQITVPDALLHPTCWLAWGSAVTQPGTSEAVVVAPELVPVVELSESARQILDGTKLCARRRNLRLVWFSDLTRLLTNDGQSWAELGVDWQAGLAELEAGDFARIWVSISERAYLTMCDPAPTTLIEDRQRLRRAMTLQIENHWSSWAREVLAVERTRQANSLFVDAAYPTNSADRF